MSRIGKLPITIPAGVTVSVDGENVVTVSSNKGTLTQQVSKLLNVAVENNQVVVSQVKESKEANAMHGLYRTLINNMVEGVTNGFKKSITIHGVGYKAAKQGNKLVLNIGFSHPVEVVEEDGVTLNVVPQALIGVELAASSLVKFIVLSRNSLPFPFHLAAKCCASVNRILVSYIAMMFVLN